MNIAEILDQYSDRWYDFFQTCNNNLVAEENHIFIDRHRLEEILAGDIKRIVDTPAP